MTENPYEPPRGVPDHPAKRALPWKWLFVAGILTSVLSYLAIVAIILRGETPTGIRWSQSTMAVAVVFAGLLVIGAVVAVIAGLACLLNWTWNFWRR